MRSTKQAVGEVAGVIGGGIATDTRAGATAAAAGIFTAFAIGGFWMGMSTLLGGYVGVIAAPSLLALLIHTKLLLVVCETIFGFLVGFLVGGLGGILIAFEDRCRPTYSRQELHLALHPVGDCVGRALDENPSSVVLMVGYYALVVKRCRHPCAVRNALPKPTIDPRATWYLEWWFPHWTNPKPFVGQTVGLGVQTGTHGRPTGMGSCFTTS